MARVDVKNIVDQPIRSRDVITPEGECRSNSSNRIPGPTGNEKFSLNTHCEMNLSLIKFSYINY